MERNSGVRSCIDVDMMSMRGAMAGRSCCGCYAPVPASPGRFILVDSRSTSGLVCAASWPSLQGRSKMEGPHFPSRRCVREATILSGGIQMVEGSCDLDIWLLRNCSRQSISNARGAAGGGRSGSGLCLTPTRRRLRLSSGTHVIHRLCAWTVMVLLELSI